MTRKDFELIADAIRDSIINYRTVDRSHLDEPAAMYYAVVAELSGALARNNPRFDRARFIAACGIKENV